MTKDRSCFARVNGGKILLFVGLHKGTFDPKEKGYMKAMAEFLVKNRVTDIMCSSSCDFPEEEGLKRNVRNILGRAIAYARHLV